MATMMMNQSVLHSNALSLQTTSAVMMAMQALQSAASIVPASHLREDGFSDDDGDEGQTAPAFVQKLKDLVDDPQVDSAAWSKDGASFVVHEPKRLSEQLPKYFKSSKLKSFVRQLHFYGFKKSGGSRYQDWVYNHKYFQRNGRLLHRLRRKTCGPDQQIKSLQSKVTNLQDSLAETQQKLGDMAVALVTLLQQNSATSLSASRSREPPSHNTSLLPAKRPRPNTQPNGCATGADQSSNSPRRTSHLSVASLAAAKRTVKQEPRFKQEPHVKREPNVARRLPVHLGFNDTLSRAPHGGLMLTPTTPTTFFDLDDDLHDDGEELLFSPSDDDLFDRVGRGLSMVRVTA